MRSLLIITVLLVLMSATAASESTKAKLFAFLKCQQDVHKALDFLRTQRPYWVEKGHKERLRLIDEMIARDKDPFGYCTTHPVPRNAIAELTRTGFDVRLPYAPD